MEIVTLASFSVLVAVAFVSLAYPFWKTTAAQGRLQTDPSDSEQARLLREKEGIYAAIKDLQFEYRTGKLSEEDYAQLQKGYRAKALTVIKELDERTSVSEPELPRCPACGHANPLISNFCEACGERLGGEIVCPGCHTRRIAGDRFCRACGRRL
ncbi:MAG: zinc ribbon domain-containing protein [Gemmatimonadales bacterium]